jgi:3-hydroxyacyl-CoA dehydrogenase
MSVVEKLTVLGAGVLGGQIAFHSAFKGKTVVVYDIAEDALVRCRTTHEYYAARYQADLGATEADTDAATQRITFTTDLPSAVSKADLVIEAVPEVPSVKTATYNEIADLLPAHTLVATNSSTLLPSDFAAATGRPEKFCALHFATTIWLMNFAEIMAHSTTSRETLTAVTMFAIDIGMIPIPVRKEHNGYVANSWLVPMLNAAQTLVTNGIATPEDIDRTYMIQGSPAGPMGMLDTIGLATAYNVLSHWGRVNNDDQMTANAAYLKDNFLEFGHLGRPSGKGYYEYPNPTYKDAGFLDQPDMAAAASIVAQILPQ